MTWVRSVVPGCVELFVPYRPHQSVVSIGRQSYCRQLAATSPRSHVEQVNTAPSAGRMLHQPILVECCRWPWTGP
jgi:hypothetical protein